MDKNQEWIPWHSARFRLCLVYFTSFYLLHLLCFIFARRRLPFHIFFLSPSTFSTIPSIASFTTLQITLRAYSINLHSALGKPGTCPSPTHIPSSFPFLSSDSSFCKQRNQEKHRRDNNNIQESKHGGVNLFIRLPPPLFASPPPFLICIGFPAAPLDSLSFILAFVLSTLLFSFFSLSLFCVHVRIDTWI